MNVKVIANRIVRVERDKTIVMADSTQVEVSLKSPDEPIDSFIERIAKECERQDLSCRMPLMKELTENRILIEWSLP